MLTAHGLLLYVYDLTLDRYFVLLFICYNTVNVGGNDGGNGGRVDGSSE